MRPGIGSVLAGVGTVLFQGDRFLPITTGDEEGLVRLYLPCRFDFGLVILNPWSTVWIAPIITADNLPAGAFDDVWNDAHNPDHSWLYPLDPIRGYLEEPSLATLYGPTVLGDHLLDVLECQVAYTLPRHEIQQQLWPKVWSSVLTQQP